LRIVRILCLSLRDLLGTGSPVLLLPCGVRLYLFLDSVLVRGFRRFVAHDPKGKVDGNGRQPGRLARFLSRHGIARARIRKQSRESSSRLGSLITFCRFLSFGLAASALQSFTILRPLRTEQNCAKPHRTDSDAVEYFRRKVGKPKDAVSESAKLEGPACFGQWRAIAECPC
jgi:hypothetical protein